MVEDDHGHAKLIEKNIRRANIANDIVHFDHGDAAVLKVQHHIHAKSAEAQDIPDLAARAGLTERTFLRRFVKATGLRPTEYLQQVRVMKARDALELTNRPVEQIAWAVGYSDAAAFRRLFQRLTGIAPNLYRQRFGVVGRPTEAGH